MFPSQSKLNVADSGCGKRQQLVAPLELTAVAVAILALMALLFPHGVLVNQLIQLDEVDEVSLNYLENIVRHDKRNVELILVLARAKIDRLDEAEMSLLLDTVEQDGNEAQRGIAMLLRFRSMAASKSSSELKATLKQLTRFDLPPSDLVYLADYAVQLGEGSTALDFYRRIESKAPGQYANWLQRSAQYNLANKRYREAADLYFYARLQANDRDKARRMFMAGVSALMADSRHAEVVADAKRFLGDLSQDQETMRFLVSTSRAAGDPSAATHYAQELVQILQNPNQRADL